MATAYESDNDVNSTAISDSMSELKADNPRSTTLAAADDSTVRCISTGFCLKMCHNTAENGIDIVKHGTSKSTSSSSNSSLSISDECSDDTGTNTTNETEMVTNSNIVSILSDYYNYVEHIKQEIQEQNKPIEQIRLSLQYISCLKNQSGKQPVFRQTSSLVKATDVSELLVNLNNVSSWFNYGLLHHLLMTIQNTQPTSMDMLEEKLLGQQYFRTLKRYYSELLTLLPSVTTGPQLHDDFEEVKTVVARDYRTFTLQDVIFIHNSFANILGLKPFIVLFQGLSECDRNTSEFVFWIPKSVAAPAITSAYQNELEMMNKGIINVQTQYETITATVRHEVRESGYETIVQSNTTDDDNGLLSSSHTIEEEDEVFMSPEGSSTYERVSSADLQCTMTATTTNSDESNSDTISDSPIPIIKSNTPVLIPPVGYANDVTTVDDDSTTSKSDNEEDVPMNTLSKALYAKVKRSYSKQIHLDKEILQEIERQNMIASSLENSSPSPHSNTEAPYIAMNPANTPVTTDTASSVMSYRSSHIHTPMQNYTPSPNPRYQTPPRRNTSLPNPHYQTPPRRNTLQTAQSRSQQTVTRAGSFHHYKNIPISFIRVPQDNTIKQSLHFRVLPQAKPTGFVKRIFLRSTAIQPANIQMIVISTQEPNDEQHRVMVKPGDRVTGLYALQEDIVIRTSRGDRGLVPYSSCRVSKAFYGRNSKIVNYSTLSLYTISTLCIESFSRSDDTPLPIPINMIIIKPYNANQRDELTVNAGDHIRLLFSNDEWVFGRLQDGQSGFVPREHCRPVTKSIKLLSSSQWTFPAFIFQSDFMFNLQEPPPKCLLTHPLFPNKEAGDIVMVTRNYTPPGTQVLIRKGACIKTIYHEEHFKYVATISGSSFWIPAAYTVPAPKIPGLPLSATHLRGTFMLYSVPRPCNDRNGNTSSCNSDSETDGKNSAKKKVSFAMDNPMVFRESMGSNPELTVTDHQEGSNPAYSIIPPRRASSNDTIPVYTVLNNLSPLPSTFCGCFKF